jgi:L-fuconolactonase
VLAGMREVARRGLCNELLVLPHQLDAVLGVVDAIPESRFVLDHLGKPAIGSCAFQPWARQLSALAQLVNVSAKISGLVTEANWSSWTESDLRPYLEHALLVFGPGRLIFGSDWPVCTLAGSYQRIVELAERLIGGLSYSEQAAVMGGTAAEAYALEQSRPEEP